MNCHCGRPVHIHPGGFTRGLCEMCDLFRCDIPDKDYRPLCEDVDA